MLFKEYVSMINRVFNEHPEYGELETVYSVDDEGNQFNEVLHAPTIGEWDGDILDDDRQPQNCNAICIN